MIIDNHPSIAVKDLAARSQDRERLDRVSFGSFRLNIRAFDLKAQKTRNQEKKNSDCGVLNHRNFRSAPLDIVAQ
jgi:hypothetical protein